MPDYKIAFGRKKLHIDDEHTCIYCHDFNTHQDLYTVDFKNNQRRFHALCDQLRGAHTYDAVLMYTGGKDSGYAAYFLSKVMKLNILALTWDNGFFSKENMANMTVLTEKLGIEHKIISIGEKNLSQYYRNRFINLGRFCPCTQPALFFCAPEIAASSAPMIIMGVSFGQQLAILQNRLLFEFDDEQKSSILRVLRQQGMGLSSFQDPGFFIHALLDIASGNYTPDMVELLRACVRQFQKLHTGDRTIVILSLIYNFDHDTISRVLSEYGWKKPSGAHHAGHTSCIMEPMKGFVSSQQGMINLDYLELAAERRWGRFPEELYDEVLPTLYYNEKEPEALETFLKITRLTKDEFYAVLRKNPLAHAAPPEINWNLMDTLGIQMGRDQLTQLLTQAYQRNIP